MWSFFFFFDCPDFLRHIGSDSDTDSTITEGPYPGQDSGRYYPMMSSRPAPVPEDRRLLPPQPHTPRAPTISQQTGIVGPTRPPAPIQRLQDPQTPMPRDSLALQTPSMQRQDPSYGGLAVIPRRPSLERDQRLLLPPGLSTSPGAHSTMSGQPSGPPAYSGRSRRDSSSPPAPSSMQRPRRESVTLPSQPSVQPTSWDPMTSASQPSVQPGRRDSVLMVPQPPPAIHRNSMNIAPQPPAPVRRATDPLPMAIPPPQAPVRRASESSPRGQGILVSTRVRFNDENLICPSPIPMHERRKGWHNRRGCVFLIPPPFFFFYLSHDDDGTDPRSLFSSPTGTNSGRTTESTNPRCRDRSTPRTSPAIRITAKVG